LELWCDVKGTAIALLATRDRRGVGISLVPDENLWQKSTYNKEIARECRTAFDLELSAEALGRELQM